MGNVFKSVANFLDKAISGKEVDVIVMEAPQPERRTAPTGELGAANADAAGDDAPPAPDGGAADGAAADVNGSDADAEKVEETEEDATEEVVESDASATLSNQADGDENAGEGADAGGEAPQPPVGELGADAVDAGGETPSMASVSMLGEGEVAIGAAELEQLRADAGEWVANKAELTQLRAWKANGSKPNVMNGAVDAADVVTAPQKKVSAATQRAIDLKNKMAGG